MGWRRRNFVDKGGRKKNGGKREGAGRPEKEVNWAQFEQLCGMQCTHSEIASFLKINKETLYLKAEKNYKIDFPTLYRTFTETGKCSLRRSQWVMAQKNTSMGIWLGKQYLGQKDHEAEAERNNQMNPHLETLHTTLSQNLEMKSKLKKLEEEMNAIKSKTSPELPGSDAQVQHLGGCSPVGEDILESPQIDTLA